MFINSNNNSNKIRSQSKANKNLLEAIYSLGSCRWIIHLRLLFPYTAEAIGASSRLSCECVKPIIWVNRLLPAEEKSTWLGWQKEKEKPQPIERSI